MDLKNDEGTEKRTSTTGDSILTPDTSTVMGEDPNYSRRSEPPWPGNTYKIFEKGRNRAITLTKDGGLCLQNPDKHPDVNDRWQCVDSNNYIGFYNPKARVYMGHDGNDGIRASAVVLKGWEQMTPRHHPDGGYQLLMPYWSTTMMMVTAEEDGGKVMRTRHGTTLWQFVPV
ncbi:hypothetical protein CEP54_008974 [Fusarium duplospermum]|uniref:Ricin B lectin domain-containing protein n=1 Tax=Fusarium duplospermum TaxID=1325734 RepID=A0A428PT82_9HYPO|nr:hypothetical protein CEP54_008974 [Fusarium duplospermum]